MEKRHVSTMLKTSDVARIFNVHPGTIRRWCASRKITSYRNGPRGQLKFRREDVAVAYFDRSIRKYLKFKPVQP
jgi:excisionase family DNA binding protein